MIIEKEKIFRFKTAELLKLKEYGFKEFDNKYIYKTDILKGQFTLKVMFFNNEISYSLTDNDFDEEYILIHDDLNQGFFVNEVRKEVESVLNDIALKCFIEDIYKSLQTKRIIDFIKNEFDVSPDYPFAEDNISAVFRRSDNNKWFSLILRIERSKIDKSLKGETDIINLKAMPDDVIKYLENMGFYPAYHMNKKHWFTICLDGSVNDDILKELVRNSYKCVSDTHKKIKKKV